MKERNVENQDVWCKEAATVLEDLEATRFPCVGTESGFSRLCLPPHTRTHAPRTHDPNRTTSLEPVRDHSCERNHTPRLHPNSQRSTDRTTHPWGPSATPFGPARVPARSALSRSSRSRLQRHTPPPTCSSPRSLSLSALSARAGCSLATPLLSRSASPLPSLLNSLALSPAPAPPPSRTPTTTFAPMPMLHAHPLRADARRPRGG
ncbi:hypothetical protein B0H13DRAFT_688090 [Mycena leptocephala]|nr:hypothetical protein B0H13DRAFT_688090 [Mycena leptocephala]